MNARTRFWTRLGVVVSLGFAAILLHGSEPAAAQQSTAMRNVVVIISDDHGQDAGAYGNPVVQTPHLDALAAEGTLYTHAFATTTSCSPSRSVVLSGLHNHRSGQYGLSHAVHNYRSHEHVRGLPNLLEEAGYRTAIVGKYHVAPESAYRFQHFLEGDERSPVEMADNARAFITARDGRPFFLYYATSDPHRSYPTPGQLADPEAEPEVLEPDLFGNRPGGVPGVTPVPYRPEQVTVPAWQSVYRQGPEARYGNRTVQQYVHRPEFELYDVEADPFEARNLAGDPQYAAVLAELKDRLRTFQQQTADPWLVKWRRQ